MAMLFKKKRNSDTDTIDVEPGAVTIMIENVNKVDEQTFTITDDGSLINEDDKQTFDSLDNLEYAEDAIDSNLDIEQLVKESDNNASMHDLVKEINTGVSTNDDLEQDDAELEAIITQFIEPVIEPERIFSAPKFNRYNLDLKTNNFLDTLESLDEQLEEFNIDEMYNTLTHIDIEEDLNEIDNLIGEYLNNH